MKHHSFQGPLPVRGLFLAVALVFSFSGRAQELWLDSAHVKGDTLYFQIWMRADRTMALGEMDMSVYFRLDAFAEGSETFQVSPGRLVNPQGSEVALNWSVRFLKPFEEEVPWRANLLSRRPMNEQQWEIFAPLVNPEGVCLGTFACTRFDGSRLKDSKWRWPVEADRFPHVLVEMLAEPPYKGRVIPLASKRD